MKISELLEATLPKKSNLPSAPSLNDEPEDVNPDDIDQDAGNEPEETTDENAVAEFKSDAVSIGGGIFALSAWMYPNAWDGGGYSDILMHRITSLASELDVELGDYEHLNDQDMADGRRLEIIFFNEQTNTMFRLHASGNDGVVEFSPSLANLQQSGGVTNAQITKLKQVEGVVQAWVDSVPEDWMDDPRDRRWNAAEKKVVKLFSFSAPDVDDGDYDMDSDQFWSKVDTQPERTPEQEKDSKDRMAALIARKKAAMAAKAGA